MASMEQGLGQHASSKSWRNGMPLSSNHFHLSGIRALCFSPGLSAAASLSDHRATFNCAASSTVGITVIGVFRLSRPSMGPIVVPSYYGLSS